MVGWTIPVVLSKPSCSIRPFHFASKWSVLHISVRIVLLGSDDEDLNRRGHLEEGEGREVSQTCCLKVTITRLGLAVRHRQYCRMGMMDTSFVDHYQKRWKNFWLRWRVGYLGDTSLCACRTYPPKALYGLYCIISIDIALATTWPRVRRSVFHTFLCS